MKKIKKENRENKEVLDRFVREKYSLGGAIKKATYKGQIRRSKAADFVVRVMFVLGML